MSRQRQQPLTDADLDRELKTILQVEPTPAFLARVRARIVSDCEPTRAQVPWNLAAAAGMAFAAAVILMVGPWSWTASPRLPEPPPPPARIYAHAWLAPPMPSMPPAPVDSVGVSPIRSSTPMAGHHAAEAPEPVILVAADEAAALQRLLVRATERPLRIIPWDTQEAAAAHSTHPVEIAPLAIEPLDVRDSERGEL
jgi:hypothetical protein